MKRLRFEPSGAFPHHCGAGIIGIHRQSRRREPIAADPWPGAVDALRHMERLRDGRWLVASWAGAPSFVSADTSPANIIAGAPPAATAADLDVAPDGHHLAFLTEDRWELFVGDPGGVLSFGLKPDAHALAATSNRAIAAQHTFLAHMTSDGVEVGRWLLPGFITADLAISHDGRLSAAGGADGAIAIWRRTDIETATTGCVPGSAPIDIPHSCAPDLAPIATASAKSALAPTPYDRPAGTAPYAAGAPLHSTSIAPPSCRRHPGGGRWGLRISSLALVDYPSGHRISCRPPHLA